MLARLDHVRNWIFDLDNTLYPASADLFAQVDARMTGFIQDLLGLEHDEARRVQKGYFHNHGTTLSGLMTEHHVDPHAFLEHVHDIEMDVLEHDAPLVAAIAKLPGRKLVFTNGDKPYALKILDRLGLGESFEAIHDICAAFDIDPRESLFVDDMTRNLAPAKAIGMTTVWVDNGSEQSPGGARDHIDFTVPVLAPWLETILETS